MRHYSRNVAVAVCTLLALATFPAVSEAQGIKGGLLYSSFKFSDVNDVIDSRAGWMAGVFFGSRNPGVKIASEINFLSRKGDYLGEQVSINYVQVPVFVRVNFGGSSAIGYVMAGPNFDIKIGTGSKITLFDDYNGFDIGATVAAGAELGFFIIEGRGTWGFRNIAKDFSASDLKTRSFALLIGARFG